MAEFKSRHLAGIIVGVLLIVTDLIFLLGKTSRFFKPIIAIGLFIIIFPFWLDILRENKKQKEIETKFLEFVRSLVETVKSGIPIPKAIIHVSAADFGDLSPYVRKLAHQIEWGISIRDALTTFAKDTNNKIISRSVSIVIEAERSGGNIDEVLQAVTDSILQVKKMKEERRSNTYTQMIQGYFVFFVFIFIMIILQIYLLPQLADVSVAVSSGITSGFESYFQGNTAVTNQSSGVNFKTIFLGLVMIQGFFAGLMIGKFSEGELKQGLKHSLILMIISYLLITTIVG